MDVRADRLIQRIPPHLERGPIPGSEEAFPGGMGVRTAYIAGMESTLPPIWGLTGKHGEELSGPGLHSGT